MKKFNEKTFVPKEDTDWGQIAQKQSLSEDFIEKYIHYLGFYLVSIYQKLSEKFMEKHLDDLYWDCISMEQKLSEEFVEKHKDKIYWKWLQFNKNISEKVRNKYKHFKCVITKGNGEKEDLYEEGCNDFYTTKPKDNIKLIKKKKTKIKSLYKDKTYEFLDI
jgi:hypothetical protein